MHLHLLSRVLPSFSSRTLNVLTPKLTILQKPVSSAFYFSTSSRSLLSMLNRDEHLMVAPNCAFTQVSIMTVFGSRLLYVQSRGAKKKAASGKKSSYKKEAAKEEGEDEEEDEEDSDEEGADGTEEDVKVFNTTAISLRLDAIGKTCFDMSRAKFEESFYNGLIRINGERVGKKSYEVHTDDEIDFIRGFNLENREKLYINRVKILKVDDKASASGRVRISFRKTNKLVVENYPSGDPYQGAL